MNNPYQAPPAQRQIGMQIPMSKPRWTYVLIGINVAVFLAMTVYGLLNGLGLNGTQSTRILVLFGAQQNQLVASGDFYRLFTSMFIHIGIIHLAFNTWALYVIGMGLERLYGGSRYLVIYILSGLGGSLVSYVLAPASVSAGASGAIFGLIGAEIAFFSPRERRPSSRVSRRTSSTSASAMSASASPPPSVLRSGAERHERRRRHRCPRGDAKDLRGA